MALSWLFGYGVEEVLPQKSQSSDGGDEFEEVSAIAASISKSEICSDTSDQQIADEWCVVVEENTQVRTVDIADVHVQRVRNRPRLANWTATEDLLIENPLVLPQKKNPSKSTSYACAARPSYAQMLARKQQSLQLVASFHEETAASAMDDGGEDFYTTSAFNDDEEYMMYDSDEIDDDEGKWTQVTGMISSTAAHRAGPLVGCVYASLDVNWFEHCTSARWQRRYYNWDKRRSGCFKTACAATKKGPKYPSKRGHRQQILKIATE